MEYSLHHFVPQFYLRRFTDSDGLLWVYDKDDDRVFSATPRNLAAERGFYNLPDFFPDPSLLERQFGDLEEQAALITQDWLNQLKPRHAVEIPGINREIMSLYLTTQLLRTSEARTLLLQGIKNPGVTPGEGETQRALHTALLWNNELVKEISDWVHSCIWTFRVNSMPKSLYTSDDPVKVRSRTRHLHWAQTSVRGAYLLIPMTPRILMYCFEPRHWNALKQFDCKVFPKPLEFELVNDANIQLTRTDAQKALVNSSASFYESYMLKYMLETESKGSPSLLNIDRFEDPFSYQLLVGTGSVGETKPVSVDLVETFNWLLGLHVQREKSIQSYRIVEGTTPKGEKVLVIWRKIRALTMTDPKKIAKAREDSNRALDTFFKEQKYNKADSYFDIVYVNGDNNLMNVPVVPEDGEPPYRVRLIEEEFKRLMFDVKDI